MRQRVLSILPLPAPVGQGDSEQWAPEQDVAERDDEEDPDLGGPVPPDPASQVRHQPLVTRARPEGSHLDTAEAEVRSENTLKLQTLIFLSLNSLRSL